MYVRSASLSTSFRSATQVAPAAAAPAPARGPTVVPITAIAPAMPASVASQLLAIVPVAGAPKAAVFAATAYKSAKGVVSER